MKVKLKLRCRAVTETSYGIKRDQDFMKRNCYGQDVLVWLDRDKVKKSAGDMFEMDEEYARKKGVLNEKG